MCAERSYTGFYAVHHYVTGCSGRNHLAVDDALDIHVALANSKPFLWLVSEICNGRFLLDPKDPEQLSIAYHAAVEKDGLALRFASMKPPDLIAAAVGQNPLAIVHVMYPGRHMCLSCYRRNKNTFALFDDKGRRFVARRVLAELVTPLCPLLSPNLLSAVCEALLTVSNTSDLVFPRTYVDAPSPDEIDAERLRDMLGGGRWEVGNRSRDVSSWNMAFRDIWALVLLVKEVSRH